MNVCSVVNHMPSHHINHRRLLEHVLPLERLPVDLRLRVQQALDGDDAGDIDTMTGDVLRALEARGLVRSVTAAEGRDRRYRMLLTGELITLRADAPRGDAIVTVPLPIVPGLTPAPIETTRELVGLATRILTEDGSRVAEGEQIIALLTAYGREVLHCEQMRFLAVESQHESDFTLLAESDSPLARTLLETWDTRRNQVAVVHDRGRGERVRSAAAIRLGAPGDELQGVLEAQSARPRHFTTQRLALLELLAETGRELLTNTTRLQKLVFIDSRTQIFNKAFFDIQLEHFLARTRREGRQMALAIADIDDFKHFNSRFGYQGGDQVLYRVAQILKDHVRPFDCVARWGGEEFAILLAPPVEPDNAHSICDRLRLAVQQTAFLVSDLGGKEHRTGVTVSIGGSIYPDDGQSADQLWRHANEALLAAKTAGKNLVRFRRREPRDKAGTRKGS
jgi:diguanylate cyclase (GGDEF)-like protein